MTRNPTTTLDQEISVLKRYKELVQVIKLPQDEPSLKAFLEKFLEDVRSLGRPPLTAQAQKEVERIIVRHLHALDPNGYSPQELTEALEEAQALAPKVQAIYESYRTELGLIDCDRLLESGLRHNQLSKLANVPCLTPIWDISKLIRRLEGLKCKREREAKPPSQTGPVGGKGTETPGAGGEDKPAFAEILSILGNIASILALPLAIIGLLFSPQDVIDFVKNAFPSKDILYLIVINAFQILGLLASFATLIMFVNWLRKKR